MPIDMALPLLLSQEDFVCRRPPQTCEPSPSSCLRFQRSPRVDQAEPEDGDGDGDGGGPPGKDSRKAKKRVTFADHRGRSLTSVKVFSQFDDPIDVPLNVQETLRSARTLAAPEDQLVLDFAQPSSDYLRFRQRLETNLVSLERCVLTAAALQGTVKVKNVSFRKSVKLRVTFDSWRSHADVDCVFVKDAYPSAGSDTFSFAVSLPAEPPPHEGVEFAVRYEVDGREHWDSNHGDNYRVVRASARRGPGAAWGRRGDAWGRRSGPCDLGIHFDRYGSPTCSHGLLPDWPSYAVYEDSGPYY